MKDVICHECGGIQAMDGDQTVCTACGEALLLGQRYLLSRVLGSNIGTTYLALDTNENRQVVIKELAYSKLDAWKSEDLFQREIRVLRQLDHRHIPDYLDDFPMGDGKRLRHYLVLQYLEGVSLSEELETRRYDERQVLDVLDEALEVLEYLQGLRPPLIHRDLKPSNLMRLRDSGRIAIIDFGAVRDLVAPSGDNPTVAGTFGYMAPEQFQGNAYLQTDLYALGVVALNLLSRMRPEKMLGTSMRLDWQEHVRVSPPVAQLLETLLQPNIEKRPKDAKAARELVAATKRALSAPKAQQLVGRQHEVRSTQTAASTESQTRPAAGSNHRIVLVATALAMGLSLIVGFVMVFGGSETEQVEQRSVTVSAQPAPRRRSETARARPPTREPRSKPRPKRDRARAAHAHGPPAHAKMAIDLDVPQLINLLAAHRWSGTLNGELRFSGTSKTTLRAWLVQHDGKKTSLQARCGPAGTITLTLRSRNSGVTVVHTFNGGMTADPVAKRLVRKGRALGWAALRKRRPLVCQAS
jgi:serine/threonine protein kinase